ncbi:myo-inositol-1(or 4)-monophosphatase [Salinihabitans flavidus]|uniref:Myo-inositol-1(Or 4)-monophosphatase n=1 Tax=Salinihabitans flavidus TaxID=569882 RepID=A0A1H8T4U2_9RHOB|nr:3'(2'),5'-bisphosphate nucleotidase CysQ [Salinihabitans flavidus]SEO85967.1 myo-inositol-1(or 4)-monophosphatase [Salinihabitans flavidus]
MPATDDLALLVAAALAAGKIATRFTGPSAQAWDKPGDAGPVTEADLAVNRLLERDLRPARPDYGWLSEESPDTPDRLTCERVFIIDPIDGTRSFIDGSPTWAHSLAVADRGQVIAAVIYLPLHDKLYAAARGAGATLNDAPITVSDRATLTGAELLAARPAMDAAHWPSGVPDVKRSHRPSLAYRLSLVAEGRFDAMLTLRPTWEWDIAAGDLIGREAGARTSDRFGAPLRFNNPDPRSEGVVVAGPRLHADLIARLAM